MLTRLCEKAARMHNHSPLEPLASKVDCLHHVSPRPPRPHHDEQFSWYWYGRRLGFVSATYTSLDRNSHLHPALRCTARLANFNNTSLLAHGSVHTRNGADIPTGDRDARSPPLISLLRRRKSEYSWPVTPPPPRRRHHKTACDPWTNCSRAGMHNTWSRAGRRARRSARPHPTRGHPLPMAPRLASSTRSCCHWYPARPRAVSCRVQLARPAVQGKAL